MSFIDLFVGLNDENSKTPEIMKLFGNFIDENKLQEKYSYQELKEGINSLLAIMDLQNEKLEENKEQK